MKYSSRDEQGKLVDIEVFWKDHAFGCERCKEVSIEIPATLAYCCAVGAPLLAEELSKRQAPVIKQRNKAIAEWADKAGVFPTAKAKNVHTQHKE